MERNDIYYAKSDTPQMLDAFKKARNTFKYLWRELSWERRRIVPALDMAHVKVVFNQQGPAEDPLVEYMWIGDIDFDGFNLKGFLLNTPSVLTNIKQGDFVEIPFSKIADWMFSTKRKAYGGFTVQLMRSEMDEKTREEHDKAWGLDFGDPNKVLVVYEQEEHPENLIEHPMSINMKESMEEFLKQNPDELVWKDELGYTMLHKETIAGNKTCVEILLQMGSDMSAKTNAGYTALDFAQELEWEHIIPLLKK
jgi:uncharacterized protein YegJ (DUF2314 family)